MRVKRKQKSQRVFIKQEKHIWLQLTKQWKLQLMKSQRYIDGSLVMHKWSPVPIMILILNSFTEMILKKLKRSCMHTILPHLWQQTWCMFFHNLQITISFMFRNIKQHNRTILKNYHIMTITLIRKIKLHNLKYRVVSISRQTTLANPWTTSKSYSFGQNAMRKCKTEKHMTTETKYINSTQGDYPEQVQLQKNPNIT